VITDDRDALRQRVTELEAANRRLVDMLWGRPQRTSQRVCRSTALGLRRRAGRSTQCPSARDHHGPGRATKRGTGNCSSVWRRGGRPGGRNNSEAARSSLRACERRERVIDLPEDEKQGLKSIGVKVTERLRFEKPHMYVEVIKRPQYVVPEKPEAGVSQHAAAPGDRGELQV